MARKYTVSKNFNLGSPSDPNEYVFQETWDLATSLSQRLQRNVRQGHVFHIHNIKTALNVPSSGNFDQGMGVSGRVMWSPATRNSVRAWQHAFGVWLKQKQQKINAVGPMVRYDDFEVAWDSAGINSRTSGLYAGGHGDFGPESVCIYGTSTSGTDITLEDIYESAQSQPAVSRFPLNNDIVKQSKFTEEFPNGRAEIYQASWSAHHVEGASFDTGSMVSTGNLDIMDGGSLCGVLYLDGKALPENTGGHIQDDMFLTVTVTVSIGASLVYRKPKSRRYKRKGGAKRGKSSRSRRSRK